MPGKMQREPFIICPRTLLEDRELTDGDVRVYLAIRSFMGAEERSWPSQTTIGKRAGKTRQSVNVSIKKLVQRGHLYTEQVGEGTLTYYLDTPVAETRQPLSDAGDIEVDTSNKKQEVDTPQKEPEAPSDVYMLKTYFMTCFEKRVGKVPNLNHGMVGKHLIWLLKKYSTEEIMKLIYTFFDFELRKKFDWLSFYNAIDRIIPIAFAPDKKQPEPEKPLKLCPKCGETLTTTWCRKCGWEQEVVF